VTGRLAAVVAAAAGAALAWPAAALAHGFVGRQDLPVPRWLFAWAAAVVLVASFVALATLWPRPRLERPRERDLVRLPRWVDAVCGAIGLAGFALVVSAGLAGAQTATDNLATATVFVFFWVAVPMTSIVLGDWFRAFLPWLALARLAGRLTRGRAPAPLPYPERLGRWPAVLGLLAFTWVELVALDLSEDPSAIALLALAYAGLMLVGMALFGTERWSREGDAFAVLFSLYGSLAPLHRRADGVVALRPPLAGTAQVTASAGTVALLCALIGTTSFDGFSEGALWASADGVAPVLQDAFVGLGLSQAGALEAAFTVGLLMMVALVAVVYRIGVLGMQTVAPDNETGELARRFAHSLVPIAAAYVVAHYFSLVAYEGQRFAYLASDPLGTGADLLGTADSGVDYGVVGANAIWNVQVGALVVGHVAALVLAHDRALVTFTRMREATRSQWWMLGVMVAFTGLGLHLLSAAAA
jgi:uncharacterized membrane protein YhaH (DUF805 family)